MALAKGSQTTLDDWALIANTGRRLGAELDVSTAYSIKLYIKAALGEAVASTGQPEIIIQSTGEDSPATDDWTPEARLVGPSGTPLTPIAFNNNAAAAVTTANITNPVTANYDNDGKFKFILNAGTVSDSEVVWQTSNSGDAGDTVTFIEGFANNQSAANSTLLDIDDARNEVVSQWSLQFDVRAWSRARILYNADYDTDGPDVYTFGAYTLNTGV